MKHLTDTPILDVLPDPQITPSGKGRWAQVEAILFALEEDQVCGLRTVNTEHTRLRTFVRQVFGKVRFLRQCPDAGAMYQPQIRIVDDVVFVRKIKVRNEYYDRRTGTAEY